MHARRSIPGIMLAAVLGLTAGCGTTTPPTAPSAPSTVTDTFTADLAQQGSITNTFKVNAAGEVTITLTSVTPLATMSLGVGMMTSDGTNCLSTLTQNTDARANNVAALQGTAAAGNYCVRVYDSGNVPVGTTVAYTVTVLHP
jgi:hypothetical protein